METPKPAKTSNGGAIKRNRKKIVKVLLVVAVLALTAGVSYNAGIKHASKTKSNVAVTAPSLQKLKDAAKNANKNNTDAKNNASTALTNSSGFFRLAGTITSVQKSSIAIKLGDGTVVTLTVGENAKFYSGTPRKAQPISSLKTGTSAFVIGTIAPTGTFTASNIQAQK